MEHMKNLTTICEAILKLETKADLKVVFAAYKQRSRELYNKEVANVKGLFSLQQQVVFKHRGRIVHGKIIKKNEKTAQVSVLPDDLKGYARLWNVPYTLLSPDHS